MHVIGRWQALTRVGLEPNARFEQTCEVSNEHFGKG